MPEDSNSKMSEKAIGNSTRKQWKTKPANRINLANRAESLKRRNYRIPAVTNILNIENAGMAERMPA